MINAITYVAGSTIRLCHSAKDKKNYINNLENITIKLKTNEDKKIREKRILRFDKR